MNRNNKRTRTVRKGTGPTGRTLRHMNVVIATELVAVVDVDGGPLPDAVGPQ